MLKIETDKGNVKTLVINGDVFSLTADCLLMIKNIYKALREESQDIADIFEQTMNGMLEMAFELAKEDESQQ